MRGPFHIKVLRTAIFVCLWIALSEEQSAQAAPYTSYIYDVWANPEPSPQAYLAAEIVDGRNLGVGPLDHPRDVYVSSDKIYIVDTGNNRIICTDHEWNVLSVVKQFTWAGSVEHFDGPMGVHVGPDGLAYIADTGNARVVVLDVDGTCINVIGPPQSEFDGVVQDDLRYRPRKVGVSPSHRLYVLANDVFDGLMVFGSDGVFQGFIGAPRVTPNLSDVFWTRIASREQRARMQLFIPTEFSNIDVDSKGFIYATVAAGDSSTLDQTSYSVKQAMRLLNPAGIDVLRRAGPSQPSGDLAFPPPGSGGVTEGPSVFTDVAAREYDLYSVLDAKRGRVFTYDGQSNLLYVFGGLGDVRGMFRSPVALDTVGDRIVVLDSDSGELTIFEPTTYARIIHAAIALYESGRYSESTRAWRETLRRNANLELAYSGIGRAELRQNAFTEAMANFRLGNDREGYSRALRLYREQWIRDRFGLLASCLLTLGVAAFTLAGPGAAWLGGFRRTLKGRSTGQSNHFARLIGWAPVLNHLTKLGRDLRYALHVAIHPTEGFWNVKFNQRGSLGAATVILVCVVSTYVLMSQYTGFVFNWRDLRKLNIAVEVGSVVVPFVLWCLVNWCLTTLVEGKGNLAEIFVATAYALIPLVVINIPAMVISNAMTLEEGTFYYLLLIVSFLWSALLLVIGHAVIHEFQFSKTIIVSVLTICGMGLVLFISLLFFALVDQVAGFVLDLYAEISFRI